jgi:hypothetical protein
LRPRRVSSASKIPDCIVAHRSNQYPPVRPVRPVCTAAAPSSVLRSWLCGPTKKPSGFLVNHRKPHELGVASAYLTHDSSPT